MINTIKDFILKDHSIVRNRIKMKNLPDVIENAKSYVKVLMKNNDPSHDWYHVERVWKNAVHICNREKLLNPSLNIDSEIVHLAALFHDAVDFKYDHKYETAKTDMKDIAMLRLHEFFEANSISNEKIEKILYIILNISWRKELESKENQNELPIELKIVRDADRLDAIGAVGISRCFAYTGAKNRPFQIESIRPIMEMTAEQYNKQTITNESTAINHFYEKLLHIKDKMQTQTGKLLAQERHEFLQAFLKQFDHEIKIETEN